MKMNNKGFAISTIIYGLSIMAVLLITIIMSTMSVNRTNTRELAKEIEKELNGYSKTETAFDGNSGSVDGKYFEVPEGESGWYRIELWGASGTGGKGAYTSGVIELKEAETLYFFLGTANSGRETDVRVVDGDYNEESSYNTRIMVAGGGGDTVGADGGTLYGYSATTSSQDGFLDENFNIKAVDTTHNGTLIGQPATYNSININDINYGANVAHGSTGVKGYNNQGDGYIPGPAGFGGSSFISGYAGGRAIVNNAVSDNDVTYKYVDSEGHTKTYQFVDGIMLPGVNTGAGYAKIEKVASKTSSYKQLKKQNKVLNKANKVTTVIDCIDKKDITGADTKSEDLIQLEIVYSTTSEKGKLLKMTTSSSQIKTINGYSQRCKVYDISGKNILGNQIDEIAVWHNNKKVNVLPNTRVGISYDGGSTWKALKNIATSKITAETETINGIHISAYQYDSTSDIPDNGTYYLLPVLSENKVVSAPPADNIADSVKMEYLKGETRQKWTIEKINNKSVSPTSSAPEYKIIEQARHNALNVARDENRLKAELNAISKFNNYSRNEPEIWKIEKVGNGTYVIKTAVNNGSSTGYIFPNTHADDKIIIGNNNLNTMRFKLIALEYK